MDLSATGLRIRSIAVLKPRSDLDGNLVLEDGTTIPIKVTVVWTTPPDHARNVLSEIGLQLREVSEAYQTAVGRLFADET